MFIATYRNDYNKFMGEGETLVDAIRNLEIQLERNDMNPMNYDDYEFYSAKPIRVKLEYTIVE